MEQGRSYSRVKRFQATNRMETHSGGREAANRGGRRGVIALDVGGTKTACGLIGESGDIFFHKVVPTSQAGPEESADQLATLIETAIRECPCDMTACAVGIIVPGWVNRTARTVWAPNIAGWDHVALEQMMAARVPVPIILDSDRAGYVKGEAWLGVARGLQDVVFVAVGTGIGAGILAEGRILHGHDDLAGSVGWMALNPSHYLHYAQVGCFEAEASGSAVGRKGTDVLGAESAAITSRDVIDAASRGHAGARSVLEEALRYLGMGIANLVSVLNPEMVVLGGGLLQSGCFPSERVRAEAERWAHPFAMHRVRIDFSTLGESAGLYGAARIALDNV